MSELFDLVITEEFEMDDRIWMQGENVVVNENLATKLIESGKAKRLKFTWEEQKQKIRDNFTLGRNVEFPKYSNFEADVKISTSLQQKMSLYLIIPFENKKLGIKDIRFFDEFPTPKVRYDYENAICKSYFEYTALIDNEQYHLLSENEIKESFVRIRGLKTKLADVKKYGEKCGLPIMQHIVIVNHLEKPKIMIEEIEMACKQLESSKKFADNYFGPVRQPEWFEKLILSWNLHFPRRYPIHILINDIESEKTMQGGYGKSELLERINRMNGNKQEIFDFSGMGTTKGLTMSFKSDKLKPGYLLNCENVACVDEFWAAILEMDRDDKVREFFTSLTSIFEHRNRTTQSGNTAPTKINPTFRGLLVGNLPREWINLEDLCNKIHTPFLQRILIYFYRKDHKEFIEQNRDSVDDLLDEGISENIQVDVAEFLRLAKDIKTDIDPDSLQKLKVIHHNLFDENKTDTFESLISSKKVRQLLKKRFNHHIKCLFDGIVKINHWNEFCEFLLDYCKGKTTDNLFKADIDSKDFNDCYMILRQLIESWEG